MGHPSDNGVWLWTDRQPNLRLLDAGFLTPSWEDNPGSSRARQGLWQGTLRAREPRTSKPVCFEILMPRWNGHEVCRRNPIHAGDGIPSGRLMINGQRKRTRLAAPEVRGPTTSHQAIRPKGELGWREFGVRWRRHSSGLPTTTIRTNRPTS